MSAATANKPPATGTPRRDPNARPSVTTPTTPGRTPARSSTPTATTTVTNSPGSVTRTRSVRTGASGGPVSARAAVKKPAAPSTLSRKSSQAEADSDSAEEQAIYLQELKARLQKAEAEAAERQKQIDVLNARLDEAHQEQARLEERAHEEEEKVEALENEKRELVRQHRELEAIYEAERAQSMREKESTQTREEELQETIQRLKEAMATKNVSSSDGEEGSVSRASSFRNNSSQHLDNAASFAPPSSIQRSNSHSNSKLINQKDKIIEDLRLELAEYQVKLLEVENAGGGRLRELEKQLLETRMTNARLMEDNESFQLLLGEKTLNGDLSRGDFLRESSHAEDHAPSRGGPSTSLADELQSVEEADVEAIRRLEAEVNSMKDQNKALTLYINKIIGRLLTHQGFESVLGNDLDAERAPNTNKELPPPPKENDQPQGFLQRAKSVMGTSGTRKPRPISTMGPPAVPATQQSVNEDPATAPSIPLGRPQSTRVPSDTHTHRRSTSDVHGAASTMFRTPSGPVSPSLTSPRNSFFGIPINGNTENTTRSSNPGSRAVSGTVAPAATSGAPGKAATDDAESEGSHVDTPSPPRRLERSETASGVYMGKGMRPLRLVQNEEEAMKARKAANRGSWFGGLFGQQQPQQQHQQQPSQLAQGQSQGQQDGGP